MPVLPGAIGAPADTAGGARVNVLLITADDMNWDSVGVFGNPLAGITPNIDRLAGEGMRFSHAHVTTAACQPSRAAWMTGRYPHRSGSLGFDDIRRDVPALPETLKAAGYHTVLIGKAEHVPGGRDGFSDVKYHLEGLGRDPEAYYGYVKAAIAAASEAGRPFFVMANSHDPHPPFAAPPVYRAEDVPLPGFLPDLPAIREEIARYFTSVRRADAMVGAVLRALEESTLESRTLVLFLSDNGMAVPFAKSNCWLNSTRTPLIVRWPHVVRPGSVDDRHLIGGIDLAPTILDAAGLRNLKGADGRSFLPVLKGGTQEGRDVVFTHLNLTHARRAYPMRAVVTRDYGYIWNGWSDGRTMFEINVNAAILDAMKRAAESDPEIAGRVKHFLYRTREELYDYRVDGNARNNLIADARYADRVAEMRRMLLEHMRETGDPEREACERSLAAAVTTPGSGAARGRSPAGDRPRR
jgi:N-sulfoglucosamine sulfohydrolase